MTIKEIRELTGMTQKEFAEKYNIPKRNIENWETSKRDYTEYLAELLEFRVRSDYGKNL